jgi:hypothetical protein
MGLLYPFPVSLEETDFAKKEHNKLILKTYGLPYVFWIYAFSIIAVVFFMFLAIKGPILKLIELGDETDALLGKSLLTFIGLIPVFILSFLFFEKRIEAGKNEIKLSYRVFGIKLFGELLNLGPEACLEISSFLSSPNVARLKGNPEEIGFQNKGYFTLHLIQENRKILIDRHSRRSDLQKLKELLESVI